MLSDAIANDFWWLLRLWESSVPLAVRRVRGASTPSPGADFKSKRDPHLAASMRVWMAILPAPQTGGDVDGLERYVAAGHADGVLLVSMPEAHPLPGRLTNRGIPVVIGGRPCEPELFTYVDVDNVGGAAHAVAHLAAGGRRSIATVTGRQDVPAGQDRLRGYRQGLEAAGLAVDEGLVQAGDFTRDGGARAMRHLLTQRPDLDAVFVASDLMAAGALQALHEAGRRVPEDVAVVGYDDDPLATAVHPPLTSVRQPIEEMGREMARLLTGALQTPDQSPRKVLLSTRLEVRVSSAPAPPRSTGVAVTVRRV